MELTKALLDEKVYKYEPECENKQITFRDCIRLLEEEFYMENADLDSMTDEELAHYDNFLLELSLK